MGSRWPDARYLLSLLIVMRRLSSHVNSKEPEHQKNDSQPQASCTGDNEDRCAFSHGAHRRACLSMYSGQMLEQAVQ